MNGVPLTEMEDAMGGLRGGSWTEFSDMKSLRSFETSTEDLQ